MGSGNWEDLARIHSAHMGSNLELPYAPHHVGMLGNRSAAERTVIVSQQPSENAGGMELVQTS
ncbi:Dihydroflavonol-4-reductase [Corchorus olitorius]|uniref:Dihydroflavonol-4-reductase n=1 Tax=Corchorus olitorius TaxID=93759 RepID=A0A1R3HTG3_9ROSI|nr:Dihydroflavonol-4-reductase [Corchorus olitorius]